MNTFNRLVLAGILTLGPPGLTSIASAAELKIAFSGPAFNGYSYRFINVVPASGYADLWQVRYQQSGFFNGSPTVGITYHDLDLTNGGSGFGDTLALPLSVTAGTAFRDPALMILGDAMTFKVQLYADGGPMVFQNFSMLFREGRYEATIRGGALDSQRETINITIVDTPNATPVPEPAAWALMIAGFGVVGVGMRAARRRAARSPA